MTDKEKIKQAILAGNIKYDKRVEKAFKNIDFNNPDYNFEEITLWGWGPSNNYYNQGGFGIDYSMVSAGLGRADFYMDGNEIRCMNEAMGKVFLGNLLNYMVDICQLRPKNVLTGWTSKGNGGIDFNVNGYGFTFYQKENVIHCVSNCDKDTIKVCLKEFLDMVILDDEK